MASVFWEYQGLMVSDFLERGRAVTGAHYYDLLKHLREKIQEGRREMLTKDVLFHHDHAPAHTYTVAMATFSIVGSRLLLTHLIYQILLPPISAYSQT